MAQRRKTRDAFSEKFGERGYSPATIVKALREVGYVSIPNIEKVSRIAIKHELAVDLTSSGIKLRSGYAKYRVPASKINALLDKLEIYAVDREQMKDTLASLV